MGQHWQKLIPPYSLLARLRGAVRRFASLHYAAWRQESGNTLLLVMIVMMVVLGLSATFVGGVLRNEKRALHYNLAQLRAYWAEHGVLDYLLSRARYNGGEELDSAKITQLNGYLDELDGEVGNLSKSFEYIYNDGGSTSRIQVSGKVTLGQITISRENVQKNSTGDLGLLHVQLWVSSVIGGTHMSRLLNDKTIEATICMRPEPDEKSGADPLQTSLCSDALLASPGNSGQAWVREFYRSFP
ncbi:hypothetical protein [Candidatus Magnetaquicoccus inordinatus]|uniref:hypothetical protein n=1 Tax=Candidatus Magnetaquicoccus inordinatus TaxID=2496818 RepID=UPI00129103C0|nr:hypothetical protein [Candidatus Magnetaquicoccus inordinatus]